MGAEVLNTPSSADIVKPSKEHRDNPKVWGPREFHQQLALPHHFSYEHLPKEIHLEKRWHTLARELVDETVKYNREYSVAFSSIDKDSPVLSLPFEIDQFFQDQWGEFDNPLFISHEEAGSETKAEICSIPSAIEWQGKVVPMRRLGLFHTHPDGLPFSDNDMGWLTIPNTNQTFIAAATVSDMYLLVRTDAEPSDAYQYLLEQKGTYSWREQLQFQIQPKHTILKRNQTFAQHCKFGLYHGQPYGPLLRLA